MELNLPTPNADEMRALRNDRTAFRAAIDVRETIVRIVRNIEPETIAAFAQQRNPGCSLVESIGYIFAEMAFIESEVATFKELARIALSEEVERMRPAMEAATKLLFAKMEKISRYPRYIAHSMNSRSASVKKLVDAGCSRADAERIAGENQGRSVAELEAELATLIEEKNALQRFVKTKDPEDIPAFLVV